MCRAEIRFCNGEEGETKFLKYLFFLKAQSGRSVSFPLFATSYSELQDISWGYIAFQIQWAFQKFQFAETAWPYFGGLTGRNGKVL